MSVLDRLYTLEMEFHRRFRVEANDPGGPWSIHTSYALQNGYEPMLRSVGRVDSSALADAKERMVPHGDARDVLAAFHSLQRLIVVD